MKVRYTETALAEISEIYSYIAKDNSTAADRVISYVDHTIGLIGKFPKIGRLKYRHVVRMLPVRRYPQYLVFYAIEDDEVVILNLRHAARRRPWEDVAR
jgi:toxin ParE1/3/4